jgi:hypothetical protein
MTVNIRELALHSQKAVRLPRSLRLSLATGLGIIAVVYVLYYRTTESQTQKDDVDRANAAVYAPEAFDPAAQKWTKEHPLRPLGP